MGVHTIRYFELWEDEGLAAALGFYLSLQSQGALLSALAPDTHPDEQEQVQVCAPVGEPKPMCDAGLTECVCGSRRGLGWLSVHMWMVYTESGCLCVCGCTVFACVCPS